MPPFRPSTKKNCNEEAQRSTSKNGSACKVGFEHAEMVGMLCGCKAQRMSPEIRYHFIHFKRKIVLLLHFWGDMSVFGGVLWCMILPIKHLLRKTLVPEKVHPGSCCWRFAKLNSDSWVNAAILENHAPTTRRILVLNKWILLNLIDFLVVLYHLHLSGS